MTMKSLIYFGIILIVRLANGQYINNRNDVANHIGIADFNPQEEMRDSETRLLQMLETRNPKNRPRPTSNYFSPVEINMTYNVIQILAFAQAEEILSISGWFTIEWTDERLSWNPEDFSGIKQVFVPPHFLWLPDIGLMNGRSNRNFDFSTEENLSRVRAHQNGTITWMYGVILDITCRLDVAYFPFDTQVCYLILTPWQSSQDHLILRSAIKGSTVDNGFLPNANISEWSIEGVGFRYRNYTSGFNEKYQYISVGIKLKRQPLYFIILVIVPFSMLSFLASLIFVLDNTGDRLAVAVSLVLSMTMYVVIVSSSAPRSMRKLPVLCIYLLNQLGLLSVATVLAVMNQKMKQGYIDRRNELRHFRMLSNSIKGTNYRSDFESTFESPIDERRHHFDYDMRVNSQISMASNKRSTLFANTANSNRQSTTSAYPRTAITYLNRKNQDYPTDSSNSYKERPDVSQESIETHSDDDALDSSPQLKAFYNDNRKARERPFDRDGHVKMSTFSVNIDNVRRQINSLRPIRKHKYDFSYLKKYHDWGAKMDKFELIVYLIVSAMNAIICLIIIPNSAPNKEITHTTIVDDY